jgi:hypothetical protein
LPLSAKGFPIGELALTGIQNRRVGSGWLSKSASWLGRHSKSESWLWPAFKIGELALAGFQKLLTQLRLLSNRSKGFELAGFEKLFENLNAFRKGQVKKL